MANAPGLTPTPTLTLANPNPSPNTNPHQCIGMMYLNKTEAGRMYSNSNRTHCGVLPLVQMKTNFQLKAC